MGITERHLVDDIKSKLLAKLDDSKKSRAAIFVQKLYAVYVARHFTYLEINPLVITDEKIYILDLAAKLDSAADYLFANCPVRSVKPNQFLNKSKDTNFLHSFSIPYEWYCSLHILKMFVLFPSVAPLNPLAGMVKIL